MFYPRQRRDLFFPISFYLRHSERIDYAEQGERCFTIGDIKNIIYTGYHEKKKDEYKNEFRDWNYAIRGNTLDNEQARICIAFIEENHFIVITVIRLEV